MTQASTATESTQCGLCEATIIQTGSYNVMAWTGCDSNQTLNIATSTSLTFESAPFDTYTGNSQTNLNGPALVLLPNGLSGYAVFVNSQRQVQVVLFSLNQASPPAIEITDTWIIGGTNASYPPAAMLDLQNNQLVVNIVWEEGNANSMVLCQLQVGNEANSNVYGKPFPFNQTISAPSISSAGGTTFLAWNGYSNGQLNLVTDTNGGVDFDWGNKFTASISTSLGCDFVPLSATQGYFLFSTGAGVQYQQVGLDQSGNWAVNPTSGCSGTIPGSPTGGPTGSYQSSGPNGPQIMVVWTDSSLGSSTAPAIVSATFEPSFAPIPATVTE